MILPLHWKLAMFIGLWCELAVAGGQGANWAFFFTLVVFYGVPIVEGFGIELAGMTARHTAVFFVRGFLWLWVYGWAAPTAFQALAFTVLLAGLTGLTIAGARLREYFDTHGHLARAWLRARSESVAGALLVVMACAMLAERRWGSVLPLVGYAALIGLPLSFGWTLATHGPQTRFDARFGDDDTFRKAGMSEEH